MTGKHRAGTPPSPSPRRRSWVGDVKAWASRLEPEPKPDVGLELFEYPLVTVPPELLPGAPEWDDAQLTERGFTFGSDPDPDEPKRRPARIVALLCLEILGYVLFAAFAFTIGVYALLWLWW